MLRSAPVLPFDRHLSLLFPPALTFFLLLQPPVVTLPRFILFGPRRFAPLIRPFSPFFSLFFSLSFSFLFYLSGPVISVMIIARLSLRPRAAVRRALKMKPYRHEDPVPAALSVNLNFPDSPPRLLG